MAVEEMEEEIGARSQTWKHQGQLDWMAESWDYDYDEMSTLEIVTVFAKHRAPWRRSEAYVELVETHREEKAEAKAVHRAERAEAAAAKKAEESEEAEASAGKGKAAKATAKKATSARKTGATRASRRGAKANAGADPFGG